MWCSLVNVHLVKVVVQKLNEINWLYKNVDDKSVDEAAKWVIEITNSTSSTMLENASLNDIAAFQAYTIRSLDNVRFTWGVSNRWNGICNRTLEWNGEHTQLQLTRVTGAAQSRLNYLVYI